MKINEELIMLDKELAELKANCIDSKNISTSTLSAIIKNLERQNELLRQKDKMVQSRTSKS